MQSFYCSNVYVKGPKEVIDRMLAAARRNVGDNSVIVGCENSVVPESVKSIVPNAFAGCPCEPLMKKRYPATVTDIDSDLSDLF